MITIFAFPANLFTISYPNPLQPPVMTTTSVLPSHLHFAIGFIPGRYHAFKANASSARFILLTVPSATQIFKAVTNFPSRTFASLASKFERNGWRRRSRSSGGPRVKAQSKGPVMRGSRAIQFASAIGRPMVLRIAFVAFAKAVGSAILQVFGLGCECEGCCSYCRLCEDVEMSVQGVRTRFISGHDGVGILPGTNVL